MKKRIISALILVPIVLYIVLKADFLYVKIALLLAGSLAYAEWLGMDSKPFGVKKAIYLSLFLILGFVFLFYRRFFVDFVFVALVVHLLVGFYSLKGKELFSDYYYFGGLFYPFLYFFALDIMNYPDGRLLLLVVFVSIWAGDTFAFFVGKRYGKRKLASLISPNKTVEGALAGLTGGVVLGVVFGSILHIGLVLSFLVASVSNIAGIFGDLAESVIKRFFSKKDSSNLIPGHGGVLDRLDSFAFAVFFVYLVLLCRRLLF